MKICPELLDCLSPDVRAIKVAVAYVKESGANLLVDALKNLKECVIITSLDFGITELEGLERLRKAGCNVYIYDGNREFHPKVYLVDLGHKKFAIIGSSNLSEGAITGGNVEYNILVDDNEAVSKVERFINDLLSISKPVTDELLSELREDGYERVRREIRDRPTKKVFAILENRGKYCREFEKLYGELQRIYNENRSLKGKSALAHRAAVYKVACDLATYGIEFKVTEKKGGPDIIIPPDNPKAKIRVQGLFWFGISGHRGREPARISNLDMDFDYFVIALMKSADNVDYFIMDKNEIEKEIEQGRIRNEGKESSRTGWIQPEVYQDYRRELRYIVDRLGGT